MENKIFIKGDVVEAATQFETCKMKSEKVTISASANTTKHMLDLGSDTAFPRRHIDFSWLPSASKVYEISADIRDYVVAPIGIVSSSIPNRNGQGFELEDLIAFSPDYGCMLYQTFIGKPTHINHQNSIHRDAKGVIFDAALVPVTKYGIAKVFILAGFDRTKDTKLSTEIIQRKRRCYSMGALAGYFVCSICGGVLGPAVTRTCTCPGTDFQDLRTLGKVIEGKLLYHSAKDFAYIETSSVDSPADITAVADPY